MNHSFSLYIRTVTMFLILLILINNINHLTVNASPLTPELSEESYDIIVFPQLHRLVVCKQGRKIRSYHVAVGNPSTPTPVGEYRIIFKGENWGPSFGPRWLGLNVPWGHYGIHGTNRPHSIGQHLSHGCIRMRNHEVIELYSMVPVGTRVTILGHVLGDLNHEPRVLAEGDVGGDVLLIQSRLQNAGYFKGVCNGKFKSSTTAALKRFQQDHQLTVDGVVSKKVYIKLGLLE
ncbi:L,D-transpeptidase family protein [Paenibacillus marinisediminis]